MDGGVLWQLKMTVGMSTQKSRMTRMLQRRIIAWGRGEAEKWLRQRSRGHEDVKKGVNDILTNATVIKGVSYCNCRKAYC